jgi:hypothetical protein
MGLQISHNEAFQRREWAFQRVGWIVIGLLVIAGLVGLLGPGPFSGRTASGADGALQVEYQRLAHLEADDLISLTLAPEAVSGDSVNVEIDGHWVRAVDIQGISPQPQEEVETPYGLRLTFPVTPGAGVSVQINFRAQQIGSIDGGVRFEGQTVAFDQFVYP